MRIIIAAGGTGGHLFPATMVRERLEEAGHEVFLITDDRGMKFAGGFKNIYEINGGQWSGEGIIRRIKTLIQLGIGFFQTIVHMIKIRPQAVIGMGGYISVPPVIIGALTFRKTVIFNADATLGNANLLLKYFAGKVAVSFPNTINAPKAKTYITGLPIRDSVMDAARTAYPTLDGKITITILGGSQGAQIFSEHIKEAIAKLANEYPVRVFQQAIEQDVARIQKFYDAADIEAKVAAFFDHPAKILRESHIFIGRAGANQVYEIGTLGIPSILVPIKHKDRQQYLNAEIIAKNGGAIIIEQHDFSEQSMTNAFHSMLCDANLCDKKKLASMAKSAKVFPNDNDAAANIVALLGIKA
ncbi:MAG: UDP-N-acetylglucosamine--N-acetylmuramyl-(pentapeptide) pyrophosphoryl-undecaprenol N-acetylglucosamine transferase [Alphaproteobacteria bacterium]|nr:UDP-N-acetylglucosamine--N-acetylmuramyl-(pentapeptide) pyrophosphoryl-undecaprenol N-acetylglucosamine transferase [Alphaproteobacteria bacterium]